MKFNKIQFPKDEKKHKDAAEWWYFNGFLQSKNKKEEFAYMHTLFRADLRRNSFLRFIPFHKKIFKNLFFSHSLLLNLRTNEMITDIKYKVVPTKESFKKELLFVEYENCELKENPIYNYFLKNNFINLNLKSKKKPLLENKNGVIKDKNYYTYYYSLTDLQTKGIINWKNKQIKVNGKSWHDHQWMNNMQINVKWDWFSIMLNNDEEIVTTRMKPPNQNDWYMYATKIDSKNRQKTTHKIIFEEKKTIKLNGTEYPISWVVHFPDWHQSINIKAMHNSQQMNYKFLKYWEGPTKIIATNTKTKKKILGKGFLEMVH
jgi:predicted secreted hydrolase